jgi:hypothetical protein
VLPAQDRNHPTQETMIVARAPARAPARAAAPRTPRTVPARRPVAQEKAPVRPESRDGRGTARRVAWLLSLLVVIVVIVVVVLALHQGSGSVVQDKRVIANGWRDAINQVQQIITKYTK